MIIKIDDSIIDSLEISITNSILSFLEDLCTARRHGLVVVDISKKNLLKLGSITCLSSLQSAIIKSMATETTFSKEIFDFLDYRIFFYHSDYSTVDAVNAYDIVVDVKNYSTEFSEKSKSAFSLPKLVVEDLDDAIIYYYIAETYKKNTPCLKNQVLRFEITHGGGGKSNEVCNKLIESGSLVYCICDSDKKYPNDNKKYDTSSDLVKIFDSFKCSSNLLILNVHELENLIPLCVMNKYPRETQMSAIKFIEHVANLSPEGLFFLDLKNGVKYDDVFIQNDDYSSYWRPIIEAFKCKEYLLNKMNVETGVLKHNATIINRLSSMLPHVVKNINNHNVEMNYFCGLQNEWHRLGRQLYLWGCGSNTLKNL